METIPTTIEGWYSKATLFESQWKMLTETRPRTQDNSKRPPFRSTRAVTTETPSASATPTPAGSKQIQKLTANDRIELTKSGSCFYCRLPGHMVKDCTVKPPSTSPRPSSIPRPTNSYSSKRNIKATESEETLEDDEVTIKNSDF